ncbi:uncharacterized protein LOC124116229 [Haliotis rufescens]|uniref:uncharacterized protein LOC124116229 n=1 Tax=Haliotis rufescens TaxID=6454 RepID=UPI001EAF9F6B|nr:uncharacterized protein LOC124116229 [Haliotis rufescens]
MSRPLFTIVLLLVGIIALQSTEGRRRFKKTRKTGFMGTKDCEEAFGSAAKDHNSAAGKEQFCTTYVNLCGDIIRTPLFPEAVKCGGCIFAWMTHCTNPPRG